MQRALLMGRQVRWLGSAQCLFSVLFGLFLLAMAGPLAAHSAPFSYIDIQLRADGIEGTLTAHVIDVAHELDVDNPEMLLHQENADGMRERIGAMLAPQLMLRGDAPIALDWTSIRSDPDKATLVLGFRSAQPLSGALSVGVDLFSYDPQHQSFVTISEDGAVRAQWIFGHGSEARTYYAGTSAGAFAVLKTFVPAGIHHILIGPDHLLFLVALLLLGGKWTRLVQIVTAFTVGHSITLSLAALNILTPPESFIEPAIALTIIFVGADNLLRGEGRDLRALEALVFGLIHGFGFANVLREFGLPPESLALSLFSFNLGVEIGQLFVVVIVATIVDFIWKRSANLAKRVAVGGSVVVIAAGSYWFVQRIFFPGGM